MNYAALLNLLRAHPRTFLRSHYLKVTVLPTAPFGQTPYYFGGRLDNVTGNVQRRGAGLFTRGSKVLSFVPQALLFQLAPGDLGVAAAAIAPTNVWVVPTEYSDTVPNFGALAGGLVTGGPDIMITALLNGCTCCCADSPGGVLMKHIQPRGGLNHAALANTVQATGAFAAQTLGTFRFFGSGGHGYDEGTDDVTIVGVRRAGNWSVYAQVHHRNAETIRRVTRFFPD